MRRRVATRGQSELIGVVLLIAITIAGTVLVVSVGSGSLASAQQEAEFERVEHAMTALDSRSALVALDNSDVQTVELGDSGGGQYTVEPDSGWIRVVHENYSSGGGDDEVIYNGTLGAVVYRNDDQSIAYQGGGVWRGGTNGSVMVSPPEFHYRSETLTLPVMQLDGSGVVAGPATARVTSDESSRQLYPNTTTVTQTGSASGAPYGTDGRPYANPVRNGKVLVTVHSEYYQGWADYFRTRNDGIVDIDHANQTATIELTATGTMGDFQMPKEGNSIEIRGLVREHAVRNFTVVLAPDDTDAARFNNLQWSMYVDSGSQEMEYHLRKGDEVASPGSACDIEEVSLTVYYSDSSGDPYQGWYNETAFTTHCVDRDDDGVRDETQLVANLTGAVQLSTTDISNRAIEHFNPSGSTRSSSYEFDQHSSVPWEPTTFSDGGDDDASAWRLTRHYLTLLGQDFDITVDDKNSDTINEDASWGTLEYDGSGRVTYMHITENNLRIELED